MITFAWVDVWKRRSVTVPGLFAAGILLALLLPVWLPLVVLVDVLRLQWRLPLARLLLFGVCWAWCEIAGVVTSVALWITGRSGDRAAHQRLQRWWASCLLDALRVTTGIRVDAIGVEAFRPGPVVLLCRHASLADSLVSAWVITTLAGMVPRYVLKRELLADPCLDIVGNRLPNHFLDRHADDSQIELDALTAMTTDLASNEVAVIFPEGTRSTARKRERALQRIAERDPERAARLAPLRHLLPPRSAGSAAMLAGCAHADVVLGWHIGFDGLDTFGGVLRHLAHRPAPVVFAARRIARADVPSGDAFTRWLDQEWLRVDDDVRELLAHSSKGRAR
jgi:1-acyl-sn-glycerol-3-phosphate acyltransferase